MIVLFGAMALAADLNLSAGAQLVATGDAGAGDLGLGHDVSVGVPAWSRGTVELRSLSVARVGDPPMFTAMVGARQHLTEPWSPDGALSVSAAVGVSVLNPAGVGAVGVAWDLPLRRRWTGRVEGGWLLASSGDGGGRLALSVLVPPRPAREVHAIAAEAPPPAPEAPPEPASLTADAGALVWVPHPICAWLPVDEANALLAALPATLPTGSTLEVHADGAAPGFAAASGHTDVSLTPAATQGALLVLGYPGDRVSVDGVPVAVGEDGVSMVNAAPGRVAVQVAAGGQLQEYKAALARGYAVWLRVRPPPKTAVFFSFNSSDLSDRTRAQVTALADNAAGWSFVLQGAYSFEGSLNYNRKLAQERARVVGALLEEAGIPSDRIAYLDPPNADPNADPTTQRACNIIAVPPERTP